MNFCFTPLRTIFAVACFLVCGFSTSNPAWAALTFNLTEGAGLTELRSSNPSLAADFRAGFDAAAANWSSQFVDSIILNYTIDVDTLDPGVLGGANSEFVAPSYTLVRAALIADQTSATDASVTSNLVNGPAIDLRTNERSGAVVFDNNGSNNNSFLNITRSNAKALGLLNANATGLDSTITFSESFNFDFDQSDGIASGQFDFVGIATHEIAHALGFTSGVDLVDAFSQTEGPGADTDINGDAPGNGELDDFALFTTLDLLRYSAASREEGDGVIDVAFGGTPFLSIDGGATSLATLATGEFNGGGFQASHFSSNDNLLGPAFAPGQLRLQTTNDLTAIDAIGFDFAVAVPEPSTGIAITFVFGLVFLRRRS